MMLIVYVAECDCGGRMTSREADTTQEPGDKVEIDLNMLGDITLTCGDCGDRAFLPAVSDYIHDLED